MFSEADAAANDNSPNEEGTQLGENTQNVTIVMLS